MLPGDSAVQQQAQPVVTEIAEAATRKIFVGGT